MLKQKKLLTYLLLGSIMCSNSSCDSYSRKAIDTSEINTECKDISIYFSDNFYDNKKQEKTFDIGEHIIMMKIAGTINYDKWHQIIIPDGYEIYNFAYGENADGENGRKYGYFVFMLRNIVPVKAIGYLDKETENYFYLEPGTPIQLEETQKLEKVFTP